MGRVKFSRSFLSAKLRHFVFLTSFFLQAFHIVAQFETQKWYFGNNSGLDFSTNPPTLLTNGQLNAPEGCATLSDASGNLLFYTDGASIWNNSHTLMSNGTGLSGTNTPCQSSIILKRPGSTNLYYVFTVVGNGGNGGLSYSVIDMSLSSGTGSVVTKNNSVFSGPCAEKITAGLHCNGSDFWILIHEAANNNFRSYQLSSSGVSTVAAVTSYGSSHNSSDIFGCMKLSPNSKKVGLITSKSNLSLNQTTWVQIFDFDNSTGVLSNSLSVFYYSGTAPLTGYGCEFSPDGTKFYSTYGGNISQFNLCNNNNSGSVTTISDPSELIDFTFKGSLQLAPNGKIYVTRHTYPHLGVINNPNQPGNACNYVSQGQAIGSSTCQLGLPNFSNHFFEQLPVPGTFTYQATGAGGCKNVIFSPPILCSYSGYTVTNILWNFGDVSSGSSNTSTLSAPNHSYGNTGTYSVSLILHYECNRTDTLVQTIVVTSPTISVVTPLVRCGATSATATVLGGIGPFNFTWSPGSQTVSTAINLVAGIYTLQTSDQGGGCSITNTVFISVTNLTAQVSPTRVSCFGLSDGIANIFITGGSGSYNYTWAPGNQSQQQATNLAPGNYTITAFDVLNQCAITKTVQILQPAFLSSSIAASSATSCVNNSVQLTGFSSGGTQPATYLWTGGPATATRQASESLPGNFVYTVNITDANNCTSSSTINILFVGIPQLIAPSVSVCSKSSTILTVSGAAGYTWWPGGTNGNTLSIVAANKTYTIFGSMSGCVNSVTTEVTVLSLPTVSISNNSPVCQGQTLMFWSGGGIQYSWSGPSGFLANTPTLSLPIASVAQSGIYTLTLTAPDGCKNLAMSLAQVNPVPILSITGKQSICANEKTTLIPSGAHSYTWSPGASTLALITSPLVTSTYTLSGWSILTSCSATQTVTVIVSDCLNVEEYRKEGIRLFPNPTTGILQLDLPEASTCLLLNPAGEELKFLSLPAGVQTINLTEYSSGVYFLKIATGTETACWKVVKTSQ